MLELDCGGINMRGIKIVDNYYHADWAWAVDTPFTSTKLIATHFGGTCTPLAVAWPKCFNHGAALRDYGQPGDLSRQLVRGSIRTPQSIGSSPQQVSRLDPRRRRWELNDLPVGYSQAHDPAELQPAKSAELRELFNAHAEANQPFLIRGGLLSPVFLARSSGPI